MQVSNPNNVKIYNLSAGKSLPEVGQNISDAHTAAITGDFQKCNYTVIKYKSSERQGHLNCQNLLTNKKAALNITTLQKSVLYIKIDQSNVIVFIRAY